jgi:hypothetical protein
MEFYEYGPPHPFYPTYAELQARLWRQRETAIVFDRERKMSEYWFEGRCVYRSANQIEVLRAVGHYPQYEDSWQHPVKYYETGLRIGDWEAIMNRIERNREWAIVRRNAEDDWEVWVEGSQYATWDSPQEAEEVMNGFQTGESRYASC